MQHVVERRFAPCLVQLRDCQGAMPPPRAAIQQIEPFLLQVMVRLYEASGRTRRSQNEIPILKQATADLVEIEEEVVDFEPWMIDHGKEPNGIMFGERDEIAKVHPEIWLLP